MIKNNSCITSDSPINSGILLKANVYITYPDEQLTEETKVQKTIAYKLTYGGKETAWSEPCATEMPYKS